VPIKNALIREAIKIPAKYIIPLILRLNSDDIKIKNPSRNGDSSENNCAILEPVKAKAIIILS
jgi:hypothetical protein